MSLARSEGVGWEKDTRDAFRVQEAVFPEGPLPVMRCRCTQTEGGPVFTRSILYPIPQHGRQA